MASSDRRQRLALACTAALLSVGLAFGADGKAARGMRFNSAGVIDLAAHDRLLRGDAVATTTLDAATVNAILAAPTLDQEHATLPFSDSLFGCAAESKTCVREHERQTIAASGGSAVQRAGRRLLVKPAAAPPIEFIDWSEPTTRTADGDEETHWYLGTLPKTVLHQVEVQFGHDAPGSFLIHSKSGKTAFVHNGSDVVAVSPDGMHLLTFNPDSPPLMLRVAALDEGGPRVELECTARDEDRSIAQFKGWRDARTLDLVLQPQPSGGQSRAARVVLGGEGWSLATGTADGGTTTVTCRVP